MSHGGDGMLALELGLINLVKTGHVLVDILVCSTVPFIMRHMNTVITALFYGIISIFFRWGNKVSNEYLWTITYDTTTFKDTRSIETSQSRNDVLQQAILRKVGSIIAAKQTPELKVAKINFSMDNSSSKLDNYIHQNYDDGENFYYNEFGYRCKATSSLEELRKYNLITVPMENKWIEVENGLEFMVHQEQSNNAGGGGGGGGGQNDGGDDKEKSDVRMNRKIVSLRTSLPHGRSVIESFVSSAFTAHKQRAKDEIDNNRYMFMLKTDNPNNNVFQKFMLSDHKTFDTVWIPQKQKLLDQIQQFSTKSGKYAIQGFSHKLTLLLHGPPGTGKTSLIKAVAQSLGRHIISVPLSEIKTNEQLMTIMFHTEYNVGEQFPVKLSPEKIVFVMEDIDCASSLVAARDGNSSSGKNSSSQESAEGLLQLSPSKKKSKKTDAEYNDEDDAEGFGIATVKTEAESYDESDELSLAGVLNALDGIVDSPGRLIIMTTNHIEKLDPALTRPGRISRTLLLTHLQLAEAVSMVEYYCDTTVTPAQREQLKEFFPESLEESCEGASPEASASASPRYTPAELEQFCAESASVDILIKLLHAFKDVYSQV